MARKDTMPNLEIEYKTLLTKDEFRRLEMQFQSIKPITQTNYYFDSKDFVLKSNRLSLRIRTLADRAELTLKIPEAVGNREYNHPLPLDEAKDYIKKQIIPDSYIKDLLKNRGLPLNEIGVLGHLTTVRRECQTPIGLMALDYNQYAHIKDYELELEVEDAQQGQADFDAFLEKNNIIFKYAKSKVARFSATLKQAKSEQNQQKN